MCIVVTASSNAVLCITDVSVLGSRSVCSTPPGAIMMNRRLVLKQLPSGQFTLTVQSLEPSDPAGSSVVMADSQFMDTTSTCSVTVESSAEPDVPNSYVPVCHPGCFLCHCQLLALTDRLRFASNIS